MAAARNRSTETATAPRPTARQLRGAASESAAAALLERAGARIVLRNYRRRGGELDLVAVDGDVLIVVEVRYRARSDFGGAGASVDHRKRARIVRTTRQMLQQHPRLARLRVRFDVVALEPPDRIQWIRHAFDCR